MRIWVVQEVAFSEALLCVGDLEVNWAYVEATTLWIICKNYDMIPREYALGISMAVSHKNAVRLDLMGYTAVFRSDRPLRYSLRSSGAT
jgi:hypothetical protein